MAFFDQTLLLSSAQAITTTAASTNIYDITGAGSGNAPTITFGTATKFGADMGIGDGVAIPSLFMTVGTAFVSGGGATLTVSIEAAPDNGSNAPGSYVVLAATQAFTASQLTAGAVLILPIPPVAPIKLGEALPRFYRVNYTVATSTFSAGAVTSVILLNPPSGLVGTLYPSNFTVV